MIRRSSPSSLALVVMLSLVGCGGGMRARVAEAARDGDLDTARSSYEDIRSRDGDDEELLGYVAEALLVSEARSGDPARRSAAVQQLSLAGTRGREPLERLASRAGPEATEALVALARVGHRDARRLLRGFADSPDASVRAASVLGMSTDDDRALLVAWCADTAREVRDAACGRLGELAPDSEILAVLVERARIDPDAGVRATSARALGRFGEQAVLALRDRLSDAEPRVRNAALESLLRAQRAEGRDTVASLLETPTSASTIEAARLLATRLEADVMPTDEDVLHARTHLFAALTHADPTLRGQAAMALVALVPDEVTTHALRLLVESEPDVGVRLSLARALISREGSRDAARTALHRLLAEDHGMTGVQAGVVLAGVGDDEGVARLRADLSSSDATIRRVAARSLARDAMRPLEVRDSLADEDALVRIQAAGGILAAVAARAG
ncbi:MAG: HEAT repeat domain-containing protein [Deltaproteobacteria bacterium]|nr:HEAT repeat domain-containing protein [Deltaproteobacteria bacterium]